MRSMTKALSLILISAVLAGCASSNKDRLLPQNGPSMKAVYTQHFSGGESLDNRDPLREGLEECRDKVRMEVAVEDKENGKEAVDKNHQSATPVMVFGQRPIHHGDRDLAGYTREANTEIRSVFTRLPNPTLVMYITPHLAGRERYPVPGYSTHFTLYETVEYALPGEMNGVID